MQPLESNLQNKQESFDAVKQYLDGYEFTLGGNWTYDNGCFDRHLDEAQKVWLRIPFRVTRGEIDGNSDHTGATVIIGQPFVLNHLYNEGLDPEARSMTSGGTLDQFQEPLDKDAPVEDKWVSEAQQLLQKVEQNWLH